MPPSLPKCVLLAVVAATTLAAPRRARADDQASKEAAEALFQEGRRLMDAGQFADACPKLADSQRLDPGTGTLLNLAICWEKAGKTASAWTAYKETAAAAAAANQASREAYARERVDALAPLLARLVVSVTTGGAGLVVTRDGAEVPATAWGIPVAIDPGAHVIEARASGKKAWSTSVVVAPKETSAVSVPTLEDAPAPVAPPAPPPPLPAPTTTQIVRVVEVPYEPPPRPGATQRTFGWIGVVIGSIGLAGSAVTAIAAKDQYDKSTRNGCSTSNVCTQDGLDRRDGAYTLAGLSTGAFIGGMVLAGGGIALLVTAPSGEARKPSPPTLPPTARLLLTPTLGGASLSGSF